MNPRPVLALAVCHKDIEQAALWLRWTAFLTSQAGGDNSSEEMLVMLTRRARGSLRRLAECAGVLPGTVFHTQITVCRDEQEMGYPGSASHLFLRTLEECELRFPGRSVLWVEPDAPPLHPRWFQEIADEYESCGHAFMSQRIPHPGRNSSHMMGVGVYPHDWREKAPRFLTAPDAPDHPMFGAGKGQPFDVWACEETTRDLHESSRFQQIFNARPFSPEYLSVIRQEAALFHRCKNGTLICELARARYPEFLTTLPQPSQSYQMLGHPSRLKTLGYPDMPWRAVRRGVQWVSGCQPTEPAHEAILRCLVGTNGISVVGKLAESAGRSGVV